MNQAPIAAADHLLSLLTVVSDPATHKTRLDELVAQENAAKEAIAELNEMAADTRRLHTTAEATTIVLDNRKAALDAREADLADKAKKHELAVAAQKQDAQQKEQTLKAREADLASRTTTLEAREASIKHMEDEARTALEQAQTLRDKLQRQAAAVQVALQ